jgi:chaperonin GroES
MTDEMKEMPKKTVEMLGPHILVQRDRPMERKSPGGIHMPAPKGETPTWGTAVAVGPDAAEKVKVGDRLLMGKYAGTDVVINDEPAVVVRLEDVYGIERTAS